MTECLLDTHVLIWLLSSKEKLSRRAVSRLDRSAGVCISIVSIWEVILKHQKGRLWTPRQLNAFLHAVQATSEWRILGLEMGHLDRLTALPAHEDHKDPYDRLLIAQAFHEGFDIVTADRNFARYGVRVVW